MHISSHGISKAEYQLPLGTHEPTKSSPGWIKVHDADGRSSIALHITTQDEALALLKASMAALSALQEAGL